MSQKISPLYPTFPDAEGQPLEDGYIYIGTAGKAAKTNQITVYSDEDLSTTLAQPIRTSGGYAMLSGTPTNIFVNADDFSMEIADKNNSTVYSELNDENDFFNIGATGSVGRSLSTKVSEVVSVKDFGAKGDGVTDDTVAFQAAIDTLKLVGRSTGALHIPRADEFYKITDTLLINETEGAIIYGDGAINDGSQPDIIWHGATSKPMIQIKGSGTANTTIKISDLTLAGYVSSISATSLPANIALSAIHLGALDGDNTATVNRNIIIDNIFIYRCRFGIWCGSPDALNSDHVPVSINSCQITQNSQIGVRWGEGNSIGSLNNCYIADNGWGSASYAADDYSAQLGANVLVVNGTLHIYNYASAGLGANKPTDADIYQASGQMSIVNAWSDTHGFFFYQASAGITEAGKYQIGQITGVRHFEGAMDGTNTPDSMFIRAPGTTVTACNVYGNIELNSGLSGAPVFIGIQFGRTGATFTGTGFTSEQTLINIGNRGNDSQIFFGGGATGTDATASNKASKLLMKGTDISPLEILGGASGDTGFKWRTNSADADGGMDWLWNCYYDGADYIPLQNTKKAFRIFFCGDNAFRIHVADPGGVSTALTFVDVGGWLTPTAAGYETEFLFTPPAASANPTYSSGDFWEGGMYYNTASNKLVVNTGGTTWETITSA